LVVGGTLTPTPLPSRRGAFGAAPRPRPAGRLKASPTGARASSGPRPPFPAPGGRPEGLPYKVGQIRNGRRTWLLEAGVVQWRCGVPSYCGGMEGRVGHRAAVRRHSLAVGDCVYVSLTFLVRSALFRLALRSSAAFTSIPGWVSAQGGTEEIPGSAEVSLRRRSERLGRGRRRKASLLAREMEKVTQVSGGLASQAGRKSRLETEL
jgi:hypothetical protein